IMFLRRSQLDDHDRHHVRMRVKELLQQKDNSDQSESDQPESEEQIEENSEGTVYLFDASDISRSRVALEFGNRKEFEQYKKNYDLKPTTKVKILDEGKGNKQEGSEEHT